jgi:hypothetical protein
VCSGSNEAYAPRFKDLSVIALAWFLLKDINIFTEMKTLVQL